MILILAVAASAKGGVPGVVYAGVFIATSAIYPAFVVNIVSQNSISISSVNNELDMDCQQSCPII